MKKYHVATGDGKAYYGVNYESYREAEGVLKFSQTHDPQAHIVEEEYHFTNADRIRAMSDEELADIMSMHTATGACNDWGIPHKKCGGNCRECIIDWLKQPAE